MLMLPHCFVFRASENLQKRIHIFQEIVFIKEINGCRSSFLLWDFAQPKARHLSTGLLQKEEVHICPSAEGRQLNYLLKDKKELKRRNTFLNKYLVLMKTTRLWPL